ncbi:hypothetical protein AAFC00_003062 [Neodothiora populina]|uniref:carnosine N-methyltransferase n=1 Tax=Neodothiora populina TaxID=2781224 RepID=A0ABR3P966_9PEZI
MAEESNAQQVHVTAPAIDSAAEERAGEECQEIDPLSDPEERRVLYAALDSFRQYRHAAHYNITHLRRQSFYSLPSSHMALLSSPPFSLPKTFDAVDDAIDANADLADQILEVALSTYGIAETDTSWHGTATPSDMDKVRSTIRQIYRDWSVEASDERSACFDPIINALNKLTAPVLSPSQRGRVNVLVPGAGLGRLVFELNRAGYAVEGNEISYHQLFVSNWILNHQTASSPKHSLFPWALSFSNHTSRAHQLRRVQIPDLAPGPALARASDALHCETHAFERMSMSSGDFCVLYKQPENRATFDAVATCFFIDTAPNLIAYIETVLHALRAGGVWINLGPLLWHFDGGGNNKSQQQQSQGSSSSSSGREMKNRQRAAEVSNQGIGEAGSFELADDEVLPLLEHFGFEILEHDASGAIESGYIQDPTSMLQNIYRPSFWVARKK